MLPRTVEEEGEILFGPHAHTQTKPARARGGRNPPLRSPPTPGREHTWAAGGLWVNPMGAAWTRWLCDPLRLINQQPSLAYASGSSSRSRSTADWPLEGQSSQTDRMLESESGTARRVHSRLHNAATQRTRRRHQPSSTWSASTPVLKRATACTYPACGPRIDGLGALPDHLGRSASMLALECLPCRLGCTHTKAHPARTGAAQATRSMGGGEGQLLVHLRRAYLIRASVHKVPIRQSVPSAPFNPEWPECAATPTATKRGSCMRPIDCVRGVALRVRIACVGIWPREQAGLFPPARHGKVARARKPS